MDVGGRNTFGQERVPSLRRWREMDRGQPGRQHPVHLFWKRLIPIAGAESRFDVPAGDPLEIGGEGGREARHRVALDQQDVGADLLKQRRKALEHPGSHVSRRLARGHEIEIVIGLEPEDGQDLVEHGAVLGGNADDALEPVGAA